MTTKTRTPRTNRRKPAGALAALAESKKGKNVLLGDIQQHAVKKSQEDNSRRQDIIHPSEMAKENWCPRATAYRVSGLQPSNPEQSHGYRILTIFQEGHDIHEKWQTWLAEMGRLWGKWECPVCDYVTWATSLNGGGPHCTACHDEGITVRMQYKEVPLDAEDKWMLCGHSDGAVPDLKAFIEIKSIGVGTLRIEEPDLVRKHSHKVDGKTVVDLDGLWKGIKRPLKSHRKQALIYLAIARYLGWDFDRMIFIYENKGNQDTKEFVIPFSEEDVEPLLDKALDVKWAVESKRTLPRPKDFTKDAKPCKECPFQTWCWAGEEEDEEGQPKPDAADGTGVSGGEEETRPAAGVPAEQAGGRVPRTAGRSHRTGRQRPDAVDDRVHEVGRVPEQPTGRGRGRRTVRRSVSRPGQGG